MFNQIKFPRISKSFDEFCVTEFCKLFLYKIILFSDN